MTTIYGIIAVTLKSPVIGPKNMVRHMIESAICKSLAEEAGVPLPIFRKVFETSFSLSMKTQNFPFTCCFAATGDVADLVINKREFTSGKIHVAIKEVLF